LENVQHDHVRPTAHVLNRIEVLLRLHELAIGFVEHHNDRIGQLPHELLNLGAVTIVPVGYLIADLKMILVRPVTASHRLKVQAVFPERCSPLSRA
jgi:hypothetical protein